jgi:pimeloyl-ACP methyl ester carboxylesterase
VTARARAHETLPTYGDIAARSARIRFAELGEGPPLVLLHDALASHESYRDVLPRLATGHRVVAPDLPGFGESEKPTPRRFGYDVRAFADAMVDLLAAVGIGRASFVGHGLGASIALTLAAMQPHAVDRLVLVSPAVYPTKLDPLTRIARLPVVGALLLKQVAGRALFYETFRDRMAIPAPTDAETRMRRHFDQFNAPAAREAAFATLRATSDTRALLASLPRVAAPSLVVWGRRDALAPVEHGRKLSRELPRARFEVLECGRSPAEELPEPFAKTVLAFLESPHASPSPR